MGNGWKGKYIYLWINAYVLTQTDTQYLASTVCVDKMLDSVNICPNEWEGH